MTIPHDASYQPAADLLAEHIILVTGAGDGIGRAAAMAFAAHGATVILLGRTIKKLEHVYDAIDAAGGPQPAIYPMDLKGVGAEDLIQMAARLGQEFGRLDGLLHNAGVLGPMSPIEHYEAQDWMEVMQVNVNAPVMMTRACLPLLKASRAASVLLTSSGVGRKARAYWGAYAVSKFAIEGFMQVLADELSTNTNIRVNSLNPGATRTRMRAAAYPAEDASRLKRPEDIMPTYLYMMGGDSQTLNGQAVSAQ